MAKRTLRGSIDVLPVFEETVGEYPIHELALITYKPTPHTTYKRQELGGVIGRDSECEHIYFAQNLLVQDGRRLAHFSDCHNPCDVKKIRIADLDNYKAIILFLNS